MAEPKRRTFRSWIVTGILSLLVLVFLITAQSGAGSRLQDIFASTRGDQVVTAGSHSVTSRDFARIFNRYKEQVDQQAQQSVPLELLIQNGIEKRILATLASDKAFAELLGRLGIAPGDALVDAEVKTLPFAFDRVTGKFSEEMFGSWLRQQGMTPLQMTTELRDILAQRHFAFALEAGYRTPRAFAAINAVRGFELRDVSYFTFDPKQIPAPTPPTDAQLQAFINEHRAQFTIPENRVITLVRFSAATVAPTVTLDEAAIAREFAFKKDSLSHAETRSVVQVPVNNAADAAAAAARLSRGEAPAAVAAAYHHDLVTYDDKPLSAIPDAKIGAAAFAMGNDEARAVQGALGFAAVKVVKITPGVEATLESVRPQIEAELRTKAAEDRIFDMTQKFDEARDKGANVADAARAAGVTPVTIGPVVENGVDIGTGQPNPALTEKILKDAFAQAQGAETDLQQMGRGEYYALKVEHVYAPAVPTLESKRKEFTGQYMNYMAHKALQDRVEALLAQLKGGASIDAVAASVGGHVTHQVGLQRVTQGQHAADLGQDFLTRIFDAKPGDTIAAAAPGGIFVAKLDAVRAADVTQMAQVVDGIGPRIAHDYVADLDDAVRNEAQRRIKVSTNLALAQHAINADAIVARMAAAAAPATPAARPASKAP